MDYVELVDRMALEGMRNTEPTGDDTRAAMITWAIFRTGFRANKRAKIGDFMPKYRRKSGGTDHKTQREAVRAWVRAANKRKGK